MENVNTKTIILYVSQKDIEEGISRAEKNLVRAENCPIAIASRRLLKRHNLSQKILAISQDRQYQEEAVVISVSPRRTIFIGREHVVANYDLPPKAYDFMATFDKNHPVPELRNTIKPFSCVVVLNY